MLRKIIRSLPRRALFTTIPGATFLSHQHSNKRLQKNPAPAKINPPIQPSITVMEQITDNRDIEILKGLIKDQDDFDILLKSLDKFTFWELLKVDLVTKDNLNLYLKANQPEVLNELISTFTAANFLNQMTFNFIVQHPEESQRINRAVQEVENRLYGPTDQCDDLYRTAERICFGFVPTGLYEAGKRREALLSIIKEVNASLSKSEETTAQSSISYKR